MHRKKPDDHPYQQEGVNDHQDKISQQKEEQPACRLPWPDRSLQIPVKIPGRNKRQQQAKRYG